LRPGLCDCDRRSRNRNRERREDASAHGSLPSPDRRVGAGTLSLCQNRKESVGCMIFERPRLENKRLILCVRSFPSLRYWFCREICEDYPSAVRQRICEPLALPVLEGVVSLPNYDEWTIDRWRLEPRTKLLDIEVPEEPETTPAFWKDLTTATLVVAALWMAAIIVFG